MITFKQQQKNILIKKAKTLRREGFSLREIGKALNISYEWVRKLIKSKILLTILIIGTSVAIYNINGDTWVFDNNGNQGGISPVQASPYEPCGLDVVQCDNEETREVSNYSEIDSCHFPIFKNGERKCLTASGKIAELGMVATNDLPFGTKIIIDGQIYEVQDRIAKKYSHRIDVWVGYGEKAHTQAIKHGVKNKSIIIIK